MNVAVCINYIPDPEISLQKFRFQLAAKQPELLAGRFVMGPFDENALELALQLKERTQGKVYALSLGETRAVAALRKALAVKVDEVLCIQHDPSNLDSCAVAELLAAAIRQMDRVDLVLCGRQSGDWDAGQVGLLVAERLGFSAIALARQVEQVDDGHITLLRETYDGSERVEVRLPAVLSITNDGSNKLRLAKVRDIMMADRKPIRTLSLEDLQLAHPPQRTVEIVALQPPPGLGHRAELLTGESPADIAAHLAERIVRLLGED